MRLLFGAALSLDGDTVAAGSRPAGRSLRRICRTTLPTSGCYYRTSKRPTCRGQLRAQERRLAKSRCCGSSRASRCSPGHWRYCHYLSCLCDAFMSGNARRRVHPALRNGVTCKPSIARDCLSLCCSLQRVFTAACESPHVVRLYICGDPRQLHAALLHGLPLLPLKPSPAVDDDSEEAALLRGNARTRAVVCCRRRLLRIACGCGSAISLCCGVDDGD